MQRASIVPAARRPPLGGAAAPVAAVRSERTVHALAEHRWQRRFALHRGECGDGRGDAPRHIFVAPIAIERQRGFVLKLRPRESRNQLAAKLAHYHDTTMSALNVELANFVLPQAPIKTLWFEFLLQPEQLEQHLAQLDCDPSAVDLVIQFMNNSQLALASQPPPPPATIPINPVTNNGTNDEKSDEKTKSQMQVGDDNRKSFALKMLAIKTMCYVKWDLTFIENKLPLPMQVSERCCCLFTT